MSDLTRHGSAVSARGGPGESVYTVAQWPELWVETRGNLRHNTRRVYKSHARQRLRRVFDGVLLKELDVTRVEHAFTRLFGEGMTAATARRVFSTLRTALNTAMREGLIPRSPVRYVKPPRGRRPFAVVWTRRRAEEWKQTRERPVVAVWEPGHLSAFLASIATLAAVPVVPPDGLAVGKRRAGQPNWSPQVTVDGSLVA